jgi:predicted oxidoreductase
MTDSPFDVIIVGAGNAALCAALSAQENGARVLVLECAPIETSGGNSRFTAGAIRFAYNGLDDLRKVMPDLSEHEIETTDFGSYTEDAFFDDMFRVTEYRTDPELCETLIKSSFETMTWLRSKGVRFAPIYGCQAFKVDGKFKFWGGLTVEASGGGPGLVDALTVTARFKNALRNPSYWRLVDFRPTPKCALAISDPTGILPRCEERLTTQVTVFEWRSISAQAQRATGLVATRLAGSETR